MNRVEKLIFFPQEILKIQQIVYLHTYLVALVLMAHLKISLFYKEESIFSFLLTPDEVNLF
jgi:hypothetical protein